VNSSPSITAPCIDASCSGARASRGTDISVGADVVAGYKTPFEHLTREEDQVNVPIDGPSRGAGGINAVWTDSSLKPLPRADKGRGILVINV
jgi:hypothetical protein